MLTNLFKTYLSLTTWLFNGNVRSIETKVQIGGSNWGSLAQLPPCIMYAVNCKVRYN